LLFTPRESGDSQKCLGIKKLPKISLSPQQATEYFPRNVKNLLILEHCRESKIHDSRSFSLRDQQFLISNWRSKLRGITPSLK